MALDRAPRRTVLAPPPLTPEERASLRAMGRRFQAIRQRTNLSQRDLCLFSGVSTTYVVNIERGVVRTRAATLRYLLGVLAEDEPSIGDVDALVDELVEIGGPGIVPDSLATERQVAIWRKKARKLQALLLDGFEPADCWRILSVLRGL